MTVIRGADIKIELYLSGAWTELTCDTTSAEWTWGAPEALGPLTECEGGTLRVSLWDPTRKYDPDNPSSPLLGVLKVGLGFRVTVDAAPAWTGVLQTWGWDRGSKIADLNGMDPIGQLSVRAIPAAQTLQSVPDLATTAEQAQYLMDVVEWPSAKRYFPDGTSGVRRGNHTVEGSALDGLSRIRFAELGRLYPMRDGRIGWTDRDGTTPPASSATINCGGVDLMDMWKAMGLGRVRNRVVVSAGFGVYGAIRPPDEYRSVTTTPFFLALAGTAPYLSEDLWAQKILDNLNPPPVLSVLDTLLPEGAEVKTITTAEFGARWTVKVTGQPDTLVALIGQRVAVSPGTIEVDVVTEDVVTMPSVVHAVAGSGSGYLRSTNSINYSNARNGSGITVTIDSLDRYVGQYLIAGPEWGIEEAFYSFDTSSIPAGATITKAVFAAMILPQWSPASGDTWLDFDIQVRSYPSGGWRPTLAAADWIVGAGSTVLRASLNTVVAAATGHGGFYEWADAGSGLPGAVVKGGITELYVVSGRTVSGTAPVSSSSKEEVTLGYGRLRVTYTMGGGAAVTTYRDAVLATSGLVGYWRLGESSTGMSAADSKGTNPGSYEGSPLPTLGIAGATSDSDTAASWPLGAWVNVPDVAALDLGDTWTIEAWISPATLTSGDWRGIVGKGPGGYYLRLNQSGYLELVKSDTSIIATSTVTIPAGTWAYVVATKSGATCKLYVNAVDRTGTVTNATTVNTTAPLTIGADTVGGGTHREGYAGGLDEVAVYNVALSAATVSAHYAARV